MQACRETRERAWDPRLRLGALDEAILTQLLRHSAAEVDVLDAYRHEAEQNPNEFVRFLSELILEDEERHHRLIEAMIRHLRPSADAGEAAAVPWLVAARRPRELLDTVRRLDRFERTDLRALRRLRRALGPLRVDSLLGALVDMLIADTKKHRRILRTLRRAAHNPG